MYLNKLIELLDNEKIGSLELTLVTGEKIVINEIPKQNPEANLLTIEDPEITIINLNYVVKVVPIATVDIEESLDFLNQIKF